MGNPQSTIHNPQSPVLSLWVTGGGYVTASGYGRRSEGKAVALGPGEPIVPKGKDIFERPLSRYGRFDRYTKMGSAAVALALRDAGLDRATHKRNIGIVSSSVFECSETDEAYHATTLDGGGALASPNLFSYTLPGIVHGECAVHFLLAGPTIAVGEPPPAASQPFRPGLPALLTAARLMGAGKAEIMLAGWIESPPAPVREEKADSDGVAAQIPSGAVFVVLETLLRGVLGGRNTEPPQPLVFHQGILKGPGGKPVESLLDLF
jgi:3-oxoacyl-[acyl-carrier-protein] synthase II